MTARFGWVFHEKDHFRKGDIFTWGAEEFSVILAFNSIPKAAENNTVCYAEQLSFWELSGKYRAIPCGTANETSVCKIAVNVEPQLRKFLEVLRVKVEKTDHMLRFPYGARSDLTIATDPYQEARNLVSAIGNLCSNMFLHTDRENNFRGDAGSNNNYANSWCEVEFAKVLREVTEFAKVLGDNK